MVDGKVYNAATDTTSNMRCYICGKTSKDFNNFVKKVNQCRSHLIWTLDSSCKDPLLRIASSFMKYLYKSGKLDLMKKKKLSKKQIRKYKDPSKKN